MVSDEEYSTIDVSHAIHNFKIKDGNKNYLEKYLRIMSGNDKRLKTCRRRTIEVRKRFEHCSISHQCGQAPTTHHNQWCAFLTRLISEKRLCSLHDHHISKQTLDGHGSKMKPKKHISHSDRISSQEDIASLLSFSMAEWVYQGYFQIFQFKSASSTSCRL